MAEVFGLLIDDIIFSVKFWGTINLHDCFVFHDRSHPNYKNLL